MPRPFSLLFKYWSRTVIVSSVRLRRGAEVQYIDTLDTLPHWSLVLHLYPDKSTPVFHHPIISAG